jgi:sigma-54 dependent transcriptional regulator, acetoin dehydrogenase operon transcriptional activator AcoR
MKFIDHRILQNLFDIAEPHKNVFDLGICGSERVALAGTGKYKHNVGKLRPDTFISEVLISGRPVILENKNSSHLCMKCHSKRTCPYKGSLIYPLKFDDQTIGAIYILSEKAISDQVDTNSEYLEKLSSSVMDLIKSTRMNYENENYINCLMNLSADGTMILDRKGRIRNINTPAKKIFNILSCNPSSGSDIIHFLPDIRLSSLEIGYSYKDNYKVKIRPILDMGYLLNICPNISFDYQKLDFIIGSSEALKLAKERACIIAKNDSPVLLIGETGTGKELFAQAIHNQSLRGRKKLITVDCSAIPDNLLESELFGYVGGAFTGAKTGGKKGKIEVSNMSSVFLDEIGELPLHLQSKLLRVIESSSFDKLGDTQTTYINTRIIAATNRDLRQMVQAGTFRKDLYYRLNVMPLEIPPLRERGGDIDILSDYFLKFYNVKFNKNISIDNTVRSFFTKYDWPGNVRELKNLIEYCVAFATDNFITFEILPGWFKEVIVYTTDTRDSTKPAFAKSSEKDSIEKFLMLYGNSTKGKMETAKVLGIGLATLYRKIKKHNLH